MVHYNWKKLVKYNLLKLKVVGLYPHDAYQLNLYTVWAVFVIVVFNFAPNLCQTINIIVMIDDLQAVVQSSFVTLPEVLAFLKAIYVVKNMNMLQRLLKDLDQDLFQPKDAMQVKLSTKGYHFWKILYRFFWTMSLGAIFFWSTYPIADSGGEYRQLPFRAWYPFDFKLSPWYEVTYIYQILGVLCIATTAVSVDTLICAFNVYIGAQFDILCDNIKNVFNVNNEEKTREDFVICVNHHRKIVKFAEDANKFANWIIMLQFLTSAVSIGITMFQLTSLIKFSNEFFSSVSFLLGITSEIFMFCWFGNEVEIKSKNVAFFAYKSQWFYASEAAKQKLNYFIVRAQIPTKISALNLFYLSLETFVKIMRTAWSYFALLHQISNR